MNATFITPLSSNPTRRIETAEDAIACCRDLSIGNGVSAWAAGGLLRNAIGFHNILKHEKSVINYANLCYQLSQRSDLKSEYISGIIQVVKNISGEFTDQLAQHLISDLPRRWDAKEELALCLLKPGAWSGQSVCFSNGNYGIADWVSDCLTSNSAPLEIAKLSLKLQRVPSLDFAVLDSNRSDARALGHIFEGMHSFVHRQHVKTHQVLNAMLEFYDSNGEDLKRSQLRSAIKNTPLADCQELFNLSAYERLFIVNGANCGCALDFVKRLHKNTGFNSLPIPAGLSDDLANSIELLSKADGDLRPYFKEVLSHLNTQIVTENYSRKLGIDPELIQAVVWIDFRVSTYLSQIYYEEQISLHKQPWFHELLKFRELTACSSVFNIEEFDKWLKLVEASSSGKARSLIGYRALMRVKGIADELTGTPIESLRGMFNSAGSSDNFLGTLSAFLQPANSIAADRLRREELAGEI